MHNRIKLLVGLLFILLLLKNLEFIFFNWRLSFKPNESGISLNAKDLTERAPFFLKYSDNNPLWVFDESLWEIAEFQDWELQAYFPNKLFLVTNLNENLSCDESHYDEVPIMGVIKILKGDANSGYSAQTLYIKIFENYDTSDNTTFFFNCSIANQFLIQRNIDG